MKDDPIRKRFSAWMSVAWLYASPSFLAGGCVTLLTLFFLQQITIVSHLETGPSCVGFFLICYQNPACAEMRCWSAL